MQKKVRIIVAILLIIFVGIQASSVYAAPAGGGSDDWWDKATEFGRGTKITGTDLIPLDSIVNLIKVVGNMVIVGATVFLGIKYIYGSAESKADVKNSLITLIVAAIAFYSWNTIEGIVVQSNKLTILGGSAEATAMNAYETIMYVCNFVAIGGIVYIGVKYMLAGADGRAALKTKSVPIMLGIIMVYATIAFLNIAISIV